MTSSLPRSPLSGGADDPIRPRSGPGIGRLMIGIVALVVVVVGLLSAGQLVEIVDAKYIVVIQYPRGELRVGTLPGPYFQGFGSVTYYRKRDQFWFDCGDGKNKPDRSLLVTFNDGGRAKICGTIAWEMPTSVQHVLALHTKYGSHDAVEQQLVRPVIAKAVNFTGPLMSSTESYAARKSDLLSFLEDQIGGGIFRTQSQQIREKDAMTGIERTVTRVTLLTDEQGHKLRQDNSPLDDFGIRTYNLAIDDIQYDQTVREQIQQQQRAFAQVATAVAQAKEAEQRAITAAKNGEAEAAKAKWEQEVIKAKAVTLAQQQLEVATLDAKAAEQYKRQQILIGEGDAEKRKLAMSADGALDRKLEAYVKVNETWAQAFAKFQGQIVPSIVSGGAGTGGGNAALSFMELMGMKAAKDLAVDVQARPRRSE